MILHLPRLASIVRTVGVAIGVALATVGLVAQPATALGGATVGVFVAGGLVLRLYERPEIDASTRRGYVVRAGATAAWLWFIGTGLVVLLGVSPASVLVALLVVALPAALLVRRSFRTVEAVAPTPLARVDAPCPVIAALSTPELCVAWQRSYHALGELPVGPDRGAMVTLRQSMLEELERRDPAGFQRWLDAGARAGGDPGRYLAAGPGV
jgi:hypothetical protein